MGKLYFRYGVMGSAKSATLLIQKHAFEQSGFHVCIIKPNTDTRDIGEIKSRIDGLHSNCVIIEPCFNMFTLIDHFFGHSKNIKWVLADESQFFTEKQIDEMRHICDTTDINIMCYGLRTDFQTKLFPGSKRLMEIADTIEEIKSSCPFCGKKAIVNARYDKNTDKVITEGEQVLVGDNIYVPMCHDCYEKHK